MNVKSVFIIVAGRVQGVGFRYFVWHKAEEFGITGWVKNTLNGNVEIEATGTNENLGAFIDWIKKGPARAIINTVSVFEITPIRTFTNFTIR